MIVVVAGCSTRPSIDYASARFAEVTGTVTMDGQPLAGALVIFSSDDGRFSAGRTDGSGHYALRFNAEKLGVLPGPKIVRISTGMTASEEEEAAPRIETIPARYNTESELTADVKPDAPQTFDFELSSEGEIEQPELPAMEE